MPDKSTTFGRLLVISPHLDDAVFSCGEMIAAHPGAVVVTVCAGVPRQAEMKTNWDADCGFANAACAIAARRAEDVAALQILAAAARQLDFPDDQYGEPVDVNAIAAALQRVIDEVAPDTILMPLGLYHRDHKQTSDAALKVFRLDRTHTWLLYEDALYRKLTGLREERLVLLRSAKLVAMPAKIDVPRARERKGQALACYASQLRGLATPGRLGISDALAPERYWQLAKNVASHRTPRISVVILTHSRRDEVLRTLANMTALPESPPIIVVDNASSDGSAASIKQHYPRVHVISLRHNRGACARNIGVEAADTPYVAFCDDDTVWEAGSLARAVEILDAHAKIAVLTARVLVGREGKEDPTCTAMAMSPFPSAGLPGPALLGFLAGAAVFRRQAYLAVGGYEPRLFLGGEEALMTLDLVARGWRVVYAKELTVRHYPSPYRNAPRRKRLLLRNALWVAWLRRPLPAALRRTVHLARDAQGDMALAAGFFEALWGLPWVMKNRRVIPAHVEALCQQHESWILANGS